MSPVGMDDSQLSVVEKEALGECFASAEARFEYEKARRLRLVALLAGGLVVLVAFGVFMYRLGGGGRAAGGEAGSAAADAAEHKPLDVKPIGSPQAKVQVLAIVPQGSDCHSGIIKFLSDTATKRTDKIRVEFTTMEEYGQDKLSQKVGSVCAAVLINGLSSFEVTCGGKKRTVNLVGTEPTHYTTLDVGEALTSVYVTEYGDPGEPIFEAPASAKCASGSGESCSGPEAHGTPSAAGAPGPAERSMGGDEPLELPGFKELKPKP